MSSKRIISSYESVLAITLLLLLIQYFFPQSWLPAVIIGFVIACLLFARLSDIVHWVWTTLTKIIGTVMSTILLSLVFLFFLTPIAWLYRLSKRKVQASEGSNFVERNHQYSAEDLDHPW